MKKTTVYIISLILTAALVLSCYFMPELFINIFLQNNESIVFVSEKAEYKVYDIISALKSVRNYPDGNLDYLERTCTEEEVKDKLVKILETIFNKRMLDDFSISEFVPFKTSNGRKIWICMFVLDENEDESTKMLYDETTDKFIAYFDDMSVRYNSVFYEYENFYEIEYDPEETLLRIATENIGYIMPQIALYYELDLGEITFSYAYNDRFTYKARLFKGSESVFINVSYNVSSGEYNFNF